MTGAARGRPTPSRTPGTPNRTWTARPRRRRCSSRATRPLTRRRTSSPSSGWPASVRDVRSGLPRTADLVVVGGGVVGAATAFFAAAAGLKPVIVEARPALATLTTPVAAGAFRLQFETREELDLARESVALFLNFEEVTRQRRYRLDLRQPGYLWLTTSEETAARQRHLVARLHGWGQTDVELLDGDEARRRFPFVGPNVLQARFR